MARCRISFPMAWVPQVAARWSGESISAGTAHYRPTGAGDFRCAGEPGRTICLINRQHPLRTREFN